MKDTDIVRPISLLAAVKVPHKCLKCLHCTSDISCKKCVGLFFAHC